MKYKQRGRNTEHAHKQVNTASAETKQCILNKWMLNVTKSCKLDITQRLCVLPLIISVKQSNEKEYH